MGVLRLRTFHASQKVEITHRKKSNKKLKRSRIAKSQKKKFTVHRVLILYLHRVRKLETLKPSTRRNPFRRKSCFRFSFLICISLRIVMVLWLLLLLFMVFYQSTFLRPLGRKQFLTFIYAPLCCKVLVGVVVYVFFGYCQKVFVHFSFILLRI